MNELVSVIIPLYQCGNYIKECVQSVQKQTYKNIEIVLVDDGSTDGSRELCDELADRNNNIIVYHQDNCGVSIARNKGLELAHGEYVIFVDGDDFIESNIISRVMEGFEEQDIDLCVFGFQMINERSGRELNPNIPFESDRLLSRNELNLCLMDLFLKSVLHAIGTKVYKKSIIDKANIRFQTRWKYYEDIYFCLSYINECKNILFMNKVGYYYRIGNANSLSNKVIKNSSEAVFETFHLLKNMIGMNNWNETIEEKFYQAYNYRIRYLQNRENDKTGSLTDKYKNMFLAMNSWMNNYLQGNSVVEYLVENGYKSVAIYGMSYMGLTLLSELSKAEIKVKYAIDRNANRIQSAIHIYNPDDELPAADVVIVTAINSFTEVKETLNNKGILNVISLEKLIYR